MGIDQWSYEKLIMSSKEIIIIIIFFLYHKLLAPIGFMEASLDCLCLLFGVGLDFL